MRLIDYDNFLFPQYRNKYEKTISNYTWEKIQEKAKERLAENDRMVHPNVKAHWENIVAGVVPFGYTVEDD